jgi:formylmethanofuran dehydrogenase subunit A
MALLRISGGTVYDPANGIDGEVRDLWIRNGVVVGAPVADESPDRTIDAAGRVVMPGGVDLHSHIAGPTVNAARQLNPGALPSSVQTGRLYAGLGYTTAIDAAIGPSGARLAHLEFADTPVIDKAFLVLLGNNAFALEQIGRKEHGRLRDFVSWMLGAVRAYGVKAVNPGGVEMWKQGVPGPNSIDETVGGFDTSPRQILTALAHAVNELQLPHPLHIHANHLGIPGNAATTLATMQALDGVRAHLTHVQFHSYGGSPGRPNDASSMRSRVTELAEYVDAHPNWTIDVGQVVFGEATALTGDTPVGAYLHRVTGRRSALADIEMESGCGVVPIEYKERSFVHALQWAIGLEWFLLVNDPWRIALTTDHPNGGSFHSYPEIIAWLMSRDLRRAMLDRLPEKVRQRSTLAELDREYSLYEIAIITRAAPARILGMTQKGHLGVGADGDVTIYDSQTDKRAMFSMPNYVVKAGQLVVENGEYRGDFEGSLKSASPAFDPAVLPHLERWFDQKGSVKLTNFPVSKPEPR